MTQPLSISLADPDVQQMLYGHPPGAREVVQLAGDHPHCVVGNQGAASLLPLTGGKHEVVVVYQGMFMTLDVYAVPGEALKVHLYCPRCHKHSTVPGDRKAIEWDPAAQNPMRTAILASGKPELVHLADRGKISIETFECPWEIGDDKHVTGALHTGVSLCRMRLVIDNNRAREA